MENKTTSIDTKKIILTGLMMALVTIATMVLMVPVPFTNGYIHLGDSMIFLSVLILGWRYGAVASGVGSALADVFTGYVNWAPWTLCIKGLMALMMGLAIEKCINNRKNIVWVSIATAGFWVAFNAAINYIIGHQAANNAAALLSEEVPDATAMDAFLAGIQQQLMLVALLIPVFLIIIAIFLMLFDIVILINSFISTKLTAPIKHLEESVQTLEYGDASKAIYQGGSYEIRHLGASIQGMVDQLQQLTDDIVREHEQKQKSELDALQSQINPHFLYNALDIIVWMIEREQPREAVNIVTALARLFRISLSRGKNIIPVRDELEHVQNYLTIQTMRYKNKFSYVIEMDDEVKDLAIIKLVVQPLVENAIYHGMDFMDGDGMITISAKIVGNELHLTVADNGLGMKPEVVERLLVEYTPVSKGSGVGLKNVNERIKLYFGDRYGVLIKSEPDEGTWITLVLPIIRYETEEASDVGQK